jgi:predicted PurR-regulated permease PerM
VKPKREESAAAKESTAVPSRTADTDDWASRDHVHALVIIAATAIGLYLCFRLAAPFLSPITWALALAVTFAPLQRWLEKKLHRPGVSALLAVIAIILIVFIPLAILTERLLAEASDATATIKAKVESGEWQRVIDNDPRLAPLSSWVTTHTDLPGAFKAVAAWLASRGATLVRGSVMQVVGLTLTFYFLFFFLRDRRATLTSLQAVTPLSASALNALWKRIADTIHATIYGTLVVSVVQGVLGGLMFWFLGLPSPLLWGVVMTVFAVVPLVGPFLVWIPAAIYLAMTGSWGKALLLTLWGGVVVGGIDNILRPILVGNRLKMHTVVTFVAVVGGLSVFGAAGLILGPVTVTTTMWMLESWRARNATPPAQ